MRGTVYTELPVHDALAPYVRLVWAMESSDAAAFGSPERIVPDGVVELVFHFGVPFDMRYAGERFARQPIACGGSQPTRFSEIRPRGGSGFVAIRFPPWSARHFFADTIANLADRLTSAEDVWGRAAVD